MTQRDASLVARVHVFETFQSVMQCLQLELKQHIGFTRAAHIVAVGLLVVSACGLARAQSLGYAINSQDETVTVFASATSTLNLNPPGAEYPGFSDATLQTVAFPTQTGQSAPKLVALAVAPALGSATPPARFVYVVDQKNSQLWSFDVSTISLKNAAAKPVSIAQGACSSPLFTLPTAITIATPTGSTFAYVANGNGTVTVVDLAASSCVAQVTMSGTISAIAASSTFEPTVTPDMSKVFVLTSAPALWTIDTSTQTANQLTLNPDQNTPADPFTLADPISLGVEDDGVDCYFLAIGDQGTGTGAGNAKVFLAAVPDASSGNGCTELNANGLTPDEATLLQPIALSGAANAPDPVSLISDVSTFVPSSQLSKSVIYLADPANSIVWGINCSATTLAANTISHYPCNAAIQYPMTNTPTSVGLTEIARDFATGDVYAYLYITEISASGSLVQYGNLGASGDMLNCGAPPNFTECFTSSVTLGNGPTGLQFSGVDPNDPPVTFFSNASYSSGSNQTALAGPLWVMPVTSELTVAGSAMVNLNSASPSMSLSFGNGINCAQSGVNNPPAPSSTCISPSSGTTSAADQGTNGIEGTASTNGNPGGNPLNLTASTALTLTLDGCDEANCPASLGPTDTVLQQQILAGAECSSFGVTASGGASLSHVATGQTVTAVLSCVAPSSDQLTATINWGDNSTPSEPTVATSTVTPVAGAAYGYESAVFTFTHTYSAASPANSPYSVSVGTVSDSTESVNALLSSISPVSVTVAAGTTSQAPSCTATETPSQVQTATTVTVTLTCTASPNDALAATINWGDTPAASNTSNATASSSGSASITLTHSYTAAGVYGNLTVKVSDASNQISVAVPSFTVIAPPTIVPASTSITLSAGQSTSIALNFSGSGVGNMTFSSFSCSGLPSGATCSFSPSSLTLNSSGSGTEQMTVALAASTSLFDIPTDTRPMILFASLFGLPALGLFLISGGRQRFRLGKGMIWQPVCLLLIVFVLFCLGGCASSPANSGSSGNSGSSTSTYQVTVATKSASPAIAAQTGFTLNVSQ